MDILYYYLSFLGSKFIAFVNFCLKSDKSGLVTSFGFINSENSSFVELLLVSIKLNKLVCISLHLCLTL